MGTLLAADVGGTKTVCGLYAMGERRPDPIAVERFGTLDYDSLEALLAAFIERRAAGATVDAAVLGVAGPVRDGVSDLTNVPWRVEAAAIIERFAISAVRLLNDLEAMGHVVSVLADDEVTTLQPGQPAADGNAALIAPGTGLGETLLHRVNGRLVPVAGEPGHTDFAARTPQEIDLLRALTARLGRVSWEHVLSGPGLTHIHSWLHGGDPCPAAGDDTAAGDLPRRVTAAGLERRCPRCVATLDLFTGAFGAEAGNLGLRALATAGVYIGGGIAPHILPALASPKFLNAFRGKGPMQGLMKSLPVRVIRVANPALLGAAVAARDLAASAAA
ncbi:MAG: glucokinase [Acidobacteria bacterium]|nr:glucokinase [Acidobacteriota bacterium]